MPFELRVDLIIMIFLAVACLGGRTSLSARSSATVKL
jgi:hypothetical protein